MRKVRIATKLVGEGEPVFIIAEAGINHNGDIKRAKRMIAVAAEAKADAVKFQTFKTESVFTQNAEEAKYQKETVSIKEFPYETIKKLELTEDDFKELADYAKEKGILFLSSPYEKESVDLLCELDVPAFKIASGEITNFPLLRYIAKKGRPIILSTGMSTLREVKEALNVVKSEAAKDIILLHCVSSYPTKIEDVNLKAMETLRQAFKVPVGFSDHTLNIAVQIAAVALGACVIEKHFTLDKTLPGPDHRASLEPNELKETVKAIRGVEKTLGDGIKRPTKSEQELRKIVRRSIVAKTDIPKGTLITKDVLDIKRPGTGIEPKNMEKILGRRAKANISKDELLTMEILSGCGE